MSFSFVQFLTVIWDVMRGAGGGVNYLMVYSNIGFVIWGFIAFKVFIQEALGVSMGSRTELPKILVKYLIFIGIFFTWSIPNGIADSLFNGCIALVQATFPPTSTLLDQAAVAMQRMAAVEETEHTIANILTTLTPHTFLGGLILQGLSIIVASLTLFLCYVLIMLCVAGSLTILALNLALGPIFIALSFDKDFRSIAMNWFSATLSYFLLMPLYGAAMMMAAAIGGAGISTQIVGPTSNGQMWAQLIGPFMSLGIVFSTNKIVNSLVGGAMGGGLATSVMGVASIIPGAAVGKAVGSSFSQFIRVARGK